MKKILCLSVVACLFALSTGCSDSGTSTKKTESKVEKKVDGKTTTTTEKKMEKKEDGKTVEKKEEKKEDKK